MTSVKSNITLECSTTAPITHNSLDLPIAQPTPSESPLQSLGSISLKLGLGALLGLGLNELGIPMSWLLGPLGVGMMYAMLLGQPHPLPPALTVSCKSILGLALVARLSVDTFAAATHYAVPILVCVVMTGALSLFHGYLLSLWSGLDRATSLLAFVPGAASSIIAIGEEMGADAMTIAVLQYIRLVLVVMVIPAIAHSLFPHIAPTLSEGVTAYSAHLPLTFNVGVLLSCALVGIAGGRWLHLPASAFLGSVIVGLLTSLVLPLSFYIPTWLFNSGLVTLGISIGLKFNRKVIQGLVKAVAIDIVLVLFLAACCLGIGYEFHTLTQIDTVTSILGLTPGGIEAMIATVMQLGGDTGLVMAMQLTRMMLIILLSPWLVTMLMRQQQASAQAISPHDS